MGLSMLTDLTQCTHVCVENFKLSQNAVNFCAEIAKDISGHSQVRADSVANGKNCDFVANGDNLSSHIRDRNDSWLQSIAPKLYGRCNAKIEVHLRLRVVAFDHHQVALLEATYSDFGDVRTTCTYLQRDSVDFDEDLGRR